MNKKSKNNPRKQFYFALAVLNNKLKYKKNEVAMYERYQTNNIIPESWKEGLAIVNQANMRSIKELENAIAVLSQK